MTAIMRQIEQMKDKENAATAGPWSTHLVGHTNAKVGGETLLSRRARWGRTNLVSIQALLPPYKIRQS